MPASAIAATASVLDIRDDLVRLRATKAMNTVASTARINITMIAMIRVCPLSLLNICLFECFLYGIAATLARF